MTARITARTLFAFLVCLFSAPGISWAGPIMLQTFDDPHGWIFGGGAAGIPETPFPTALGGPAGLTDRYLQLLSTGGAGPGSRLTAINRTEWAGNYTAAGATTLEMDFNNFGTSDLSLRLVFLDLDAGLPVNAAFTTAFASPAGSGWLHATFDISAAALTAALGTSAGALADVDELRIFHNSNPTYVPGQIPPVTATLGVDNISRNGVPAPTAPEPAVLTLLFAAGAVSYRRLRRS